jgi:probable HAF family extracellular repeat protein
MDGFRNGLSWLLGSTGKAHARHRHEIKLRIEGLEDRRVLSTIVDLGTLGGLGNLSVAGVNDAGQVTGTSPTAAGSLDAFLWDATNGMQDLGALVPGGFSMGLALNSSGHVAGFGNVDPYPSQHAFIYVDGTMTDLGTLGGAYSNAWGVNNLDQVVGEASVPGDSEFHVFLWDSGQMTDLGTLGGPFAGGTGINDAGQIVGFSRDSNFVSHAFLWDSTNGIQDLGTLGGPQSNATAINACGQVTGASDTLDGRTHAFIWDSINGMQDIGTISGFQTSVARAINDSGQVVGESIQNVPHVQHGFLWDGANMTDLNNLLPANSGWVVTNAYRINNNGQIAGLGVHNGQMAAYLLTLDGSSLGIHSGTAYKGLSVAADHTPSLSFTAADPLLPTPTRAADHNALSATASATLDAPQQGTQGSDRVDDFFAFHHQAVQESLELSSIWGR